MIATSMLEGGIKQVPMGIDYLNQFSNIHNFHSNDPPAALSVPSVSTQKVWLKMN